MGCRVRFVLILMQKTPIRIFFGHFLCSQNCAVRALGTGRDNDFSAEYFEHLSSLDRNIVRHQNCYWIPLELRNSRERDASVST